jgi:hypothetical protein
MTSAPLELRLYFDPGHPPIAVWLDAMTGELLADVPVVEG